MCRTHVGPEAQDSVNGEGHHVSVGSSIADCRFLDRFASAGFWAFMFRLFRACMNQNFNRRPTSRSALCTSDRRHPALAVNNNTANCCIVALLVPKSHRGIARVLTIRAVADAAKGLKQDRPNRLPRRKSSHLRGPTLGCDKNCLAHWVVLIQLVSSPAATRGIHL